MAGKYELEHIPGGEEHRIALSGTRLGLIARGRKEASSLTSPTFEALQFADLMSFDFIVLDFDRGDIESGNTTDVMGVLMQLLERGAATKFCERVEVCCTGYNSDSRELWEIPQVRNFVRALDRLFPYWCYFLTRNGEGLLWLTYCLYPLAQTQDERQRLWIPAIAEYIERRGIPQMNVMCRYVGCSNEEVLRLTNSAVRYLVNKPQGKYATDQDTQHHRAQTSQRFSRGPEGNDANAQFHLGSLYCRSDAESKSKGDFVITQDYGLAGMWFRKAADNGHAGAQNALGVLYHFGHGVERDDKQAMLWYRKAAERGDADAQYNLGNAYFYGNGIARDYTQAAFWFRKAADQGYAGAQFALGVLYDDGKGVSQDPAKAANWFQKAAEQGLADAQYNVGIKYTKGEGLPEDYDQAATWLKKAVSQGHAEAKAVLEIFYSKGLVPRG